MTRSRRFRRPRLPRRPWQALLVLLLLIGLAALRQWRPDWFRPAARPPIEPGLYRVARVIDGDTLLLESPHEHVRLIGADTPETVKADWPVEPWGPEASQFSKRFLAGGEARLEFDGPPRDKYGRILAYVWVGGRMLNEELLRAGLAKAELQYPYAAAVKARFRRAEAAARAARRGIWSAAKGAAAGRRY
jgi:endonuclease YncB( thermonuclease family)